MIKICDASIAHLLLFIFRLYLENGKFPTEWIKINVVPTQKKRDKQNLKNYRQISLIPVAGKILKEYYIMYELFTESNLISPNQSGFKPSNSNINQLLSISREVYKRRYIFSYFKSI